jgi:integrase
MSHKPESAVIAKPDQPAQADSLISTEQAALRTYLQASSSDNTRKTYRSALRQFEKWGGRLPCNRDVLVRYLLAHAETRNPRTLDLHMTAISQWHQLQGIYDPVQDPLVRKSMEGIRRVHGRPANKARALSLDHLARLLDHLQQQTQDLRTTRDKALLLTAFMGAFRRSELVAIRAEDLTFSSDGVRVRLSRSKTDQAGKGLIRALPAGPQGCCPATALNEWLTRSAISTGPVFRAINRWGQLQDAALNPASVNSLLKQLGSACGIDEALEFSSHSFRRGMSTAAARAGVDFELIRKQGGWKNDATVRGYIDEGRQMEDNAATTLQEQLWQRLRPLADQ